MQSTASYKLHEKGLISKEHIVTHTHLNFDHHYSSTLHIKFCNKLKFKFCNCPTLVGNSHYGHTHQQYQQQVLYIETIIKAL